MKPTDTIKSSKDFRAAEAIAAFMRGMGYEYVENDRWNNTYWLHSLNKDTIAPEAAAALYTAFRRGEVAARLDELEKTRRYDDMDDNDEHIEVERCIVERIAALRREMEELK